MRSFIFKFIQSFLVVCALNLLCFLRFQQWFLFYFMLLTIYLIYIYIIFKIIQIYFTHIIHQICIYQEINKAPRVCFTSTAKVSTNSTNKTTPAQAKVKVAAAGEALWADSVWALDLGTETAWEKAVCMIWTCCLMQKMWCHGFIIT